MPRFGSTLADLAASGPTPHVSIGPSRELIAVSIALGRPTVSPHTVEALIDTGAETTVINPKTVRRLCTGPVGAVRINTPSAVDPLLCTAINRYHINVYFSESFAVENIFAIEAPMSGLPYQCLIGRDILRRASFLYNGNADEFVLTF